MTKEEQALSDLLFKAIQDADDLNRPYKINAWLEFLQAVQIRISIT